MVLNLLAFTNLLRQLANVQLSMPLAQKWSSIALVAIPSVSTASIIDKSSASL